MNKSIISALVITAALALCARYSNPAHCIDQVIKLYICQTEHDLAEIIASETADPDKYAAATKKGRKSPLDAARETARLMVADEKLGCDKDNQVAIEQFKVEKGVKKIYRAVLSGQELERYCPETIKKHGNPCK